MTIRLRLDISYDGAPFHGWAVQPGRATVAGVLSEALALLLRGAVPMVVAGRTDAGVHATGQVAHIDVDEPSLRALTPRHLAADEEPTGSTDRTDPAADTAAGLAAALTGLRRRLAGILPAEVRVRRITRAPAGFDARFAALRRHYRYRIGCSDWGLPPLERLGVLARRRPLDAAAMRLAAAGLLGLHDFAAYCKPRPGGTTIRDLQRLDVSGAPLAVDAGAATGSLITISASADAFCHSMVRSLVGALLAVGEGRWGPERPAELLAARVRTAEIAVAPAGGLTLVGVDYPPDDQLAARVGQTRAMRRACEAEGTAGAAADPA